MKSVRSTFAALALLAIGGAAVTAPALAGGVHLGDAIPMAETKMMNVDGKNVTFAQAQGEKGTLIVFSCNGCPWVVAWQDRMVELGNRFAKEGVGVVFVNSNDPKAAKADGYDAMKERSKELGMKFPYVVDETSDVARAFGATRTPEAFLFDAKGKLVYHGTIDDNAKKPEEVSATYLADALSAVVAGKDVPVAETKALGCTIKFRGDKKDKAEKKSESS